MPRTSLTLSAVVMFLVLTAAPVLSQQIPADVNAAVSLNPQVRFHSEDLPGAVQTSVKARIGRMFAGAVVGGWFGYFASQIAVSDWESGNNTSLGTHRGAWAAAGLVSGALVGRLINPGAARPATDLEMDRGRSVLTREMIVASGAANAEDLIRSYRAEWMQPRGVNSFAETASGYGAGRTLVVIPGEDHIIVYVDNTSVGGTQHLPGIALADVWQIEFIPGPQATFRWGAGHAHGVIHITTIGASRR